MLHYLIIAFLLSFTISVLVIRISFKHRKLLSENLHHGPQRFHQIPAPRLGGIALFSALLGGLLISYLKGDLFRNNFLLLLLCSIPAFLAGLLEDLTGKIKVKWRLLLIALSAALAYYFLTAKIQRLDLPYVDTIFSIGLISFFFTVFAVTGVTNSINIIDGFNGLASMVSIIILLSFSFVSYKMGDYFLTTFSLTLVGALIGFFLLNYPAGFIFLGDGGAYLTGFIIAELAVLLVAKHPEVSPWFPFVVCIYPIFETLFSIYRKKVLRGISPGLPDGLHLHMLIYKILTKKLLGPLADKTLRNALTSPILWGMAMISVIPALLFWNNTLLLLLASLIFSLLYIYFYWKLIYLKMPKYLRQKS
ncbi:MAG: MraY family glycosyltransferase [Caldimicrobium sp.]